MLIESPARLPSFLRKWQWQHIKQAIRTRRGKGEVVPGRLHHNRRREGQMEARNDNLQTIMNKVKVVHPFGCSGTWTYMAMVRIAESSLILAAPQPKNLARRELRYLSRQGQARQAGGAWREPAIPLITVMTSCRLAGLVPVVQALWTFNPIHLRYAGTASLSVRQRVPDDPTGPTGFADLAKYTRRVGMPKYRSANN